MEVEKEVILAALEKTGGNKTPLPSGGSEEGGIQPLSGSGERGDSGGAGKNGRQQN
ncbi:hypothetical protein CK247_31520, partial [Klebsiella pneumoniae]